MALPCLSCKQPLGLTIEFIMKNPLSQCPYCGVIMNFKPDAKIVNEYKNALDEIGDSEYTLVFSDDEEWCRNNVEFNENCLFINSDDLSCLKIMSLCKKQIMANSTFSWWGAYLSDAIKVVLPEVWYRPESNQRPLSDRKLPEWISI